MKRGAFPISRYYIWGFTFWDFAGFIFKYTNYKKVKPITIKVSLKFQRIKRLHFFFGLHIVKFLLSSQVKWKQISSYKCNYVIISRLQSQVTLSKAVYSKQSICVTNSVFTNFSNKYKTKVSFVICAIISNTFSTHSCRP